MNLRVKEQNSPEPGSCQSRAPLSLFARPVPFRRQKFPAAFTLLELLVVIVIIGLLATIGLPAIRGMTKSNSLAAADRQLLDDIGYARTRAIADHTTVYMVFMPPITNGAAQFPLTNSVAVNNVLSNLYAGQFTTYALLSLRSVGDQPGRSSPRYLTDWRTLPTGVYIATNKFISVLNLAPPFLQDVAFPFPVATNAGPYFLPYIAFNYLGQLVDGATGQLVNSQQREFIPLARGSIFYAMDPSGGILPEYPDLTENPPGNAYYTSYNSINALNNQPLPNSESGAIYNQIQVDPLTGRARVERQEVQ